MCCFFLEKEGDCPSHIIVLHKGRFYKVEVFHPGGGQLTMAEWQKILDLITQDSLERPWGDNIAGLTSDNRDSWAEVSFFYFYTFSNLIYYKFTNLNREYKHFLVLKN